MARLVDAIPKQALSKVAESVLDETGGDLSTQDHALCQSAVAACAAISEDMQTVQATVLDAFAAAKVDVAPTGDAIAARRLQFHEIGLQVSRVDFGAALSVLGELGFNAAVPISGGREMVLTRTLDQIQLVRFDAETTRVNLKLSGDGASKIPKALRPGLPDVALIDLPASVSWLYYAAKPIRILRERLTGRRSAFHEIDFLGTPEGLIRPILDSLHLQTSDVLFDLGCGDGRILKAAAETYGCRAVGVEHNPELAARATEVAAASRVPELIEVVEGSFRNANLSRATVVFVFLPRHVLRHALDGIIGLVPPGCSIVMHEQSKPLEGFEPDWSNAVFNASGVTIVRSKTV